MKKKKTGAYINDQDSVGNTSLLLVNEFYKHKTKKTQTLTYLFVLLFVHTQAAMKGNEEMVDLLLASKCFVNAKDVRGRTALHVSFNFWKKKETNIENKHEWIKHKHERKFSLLLVMDILQLLKNYCLKEQVGKQHKKTYKQTQTNLKKRNKQT